MTLLWLSLAFIAGLVGGNAANLPAAPLLVAATAFALGAIRVPSPWRLGPLLAAAALLGVARGAPVAVPSSPGVIQYYTGRDVQVDGIVDAEPDVRDTGIRYVVRVRTVTLGGSARVVSGRVQVQTPRSEEFDYGDELRLTGRLLMPVNTSTLPWRDILAREGIRAEMRYPAALDAGPVSTGILGWIVPLRLRLEQGINAWLPEPEAALLIAITLGAKSASLGDVAPALVSTGLIHIIAISGIKVAMVAGTLYAFFRRLRVRLLTLLVALASLAIYILLTGATASGERSGLMWAMVFAAVYLGRGTVPLVSLGLVAAIMAALDPALPWDIGFQLSTIGTFAIIALGAPLDHLFHRVPAPWREALSTTIAAQIGTVPIVISGFHVVALAGPLANALVLPCLSVLIGLGFLLGAAAGLSVLAAPLGSLAYAILHLLITLATLLARVGAIPAPAATPAIAILYYACLGAAALWILRRVDWMPLSHRNMRVREVSLALLAGTSVALTSFGARSASAGGLTWLGTGNAMLLTSGGRVVLIDGGPKPFVLLERLGRILPYRQHTIDVVVDTDPRASNVTSLLEVLNHYRVLEVLDVGTEYPSLTYARWRAALDSRHIPVYALRTGARVRLGNVTLASLGPNDLYPNPRDCIGLLRVSWRSRSILLIGSASDREQVEAVFRQVNLRSDILLTREPLAPNLLKAVHPNSIYTGALPPSTHVRVRRLGTTPLRLVATG